MPEIVGGFWDGHVIYPPIPPTKWVLTHDSVLCSYSYEYRVDPVTGVGKLYLTDIKEKKNVDTSPSTNA